MYRGGRVVVRFKMERGSSRVEGYVRGVIDAIETGNMETLKLEKYDIEHDDHRDETVTFAEQDQYTSINTAADNDSPTRSDSSSPTEALVTLSSQEELVFDIADPMQETHCILCLNNAVHSQIAFKIKTTSPERYRVRPSSGLIKPGSFSDINLYLQPGGHAMVTRDKFLVMCMRVDDDVTTSSQVAEMWKTTSKANIEEHRLRCVLGGSEEDGKRNAGSVDISQVEDQLHKINDKLQQITAANCRLERRLTNMQRLHLFIFLSILVVAIAIILTLNWNSLSLNQYSVNSCVPAFLQ